MSSAIQMDEMMIDPALLEMEDEDAEGELVDEGVALIQVEPTVGHLNW
jgi:hypothetical protein